MAERVPSYLSARSADIILSEIRPTEIKQEALLSLNVLLDELLWLILNSSRSFSTEKLKSDGLLKVLPTAIGKDAVLEAEVELRAYWDRTDPQGRGAAIQDNTPAKPSSFPLQLAFELMRQKCEVYSTLGDVEEDFDEETRLQNQLLASGPSAPRPEAVAPAALYITAILDHHQPHCAWFSRHILSNVARVVARDSSRATAHVNDLYVALCEDDSIYHLFKRMKVKDQIEAQSKPIRPRRSKSITSATRNGATSPPLLRSSTSSPQPPRVSESSAKPRVSIEMPNAGTNNARLSIEKPRGLKLFGGGGSSGAQIELAQNGQATKGHNRSESDHLKRSGTNFQIEDDYEPALSPKATRHDFDELMRSGTTMKVSLTPDRLKTFEVFAKEKNQRNRANSGASMTIPPSSEPIPPLPTAATPRKHSPSNFSPRPAKVEAIEEDQEESLAPDGSKSRARTQSLAQFLQEAPPWEPKDAPQSVDSPSPVPPEPTSAPPLTRKRSSSITKSSPVSVIPTLVAGGGFLSRKQSNGRINGPAEPIRTSGGSGAGPKTKSTQGRFGRMMSRLSRSSSNEHISSKKSASSVEDLSKSSTSQGSFKYGGMNGLANKPVIPPINRPAPPPVATSGELDSSNRSRKESLFRRKTGRMAAGSASVAGPIEIPSGVAAALSSSKGKRPGTASSLPEKTTQDTPPMETAGVLVVPPLPRPSRSPSPSRDASYAATALVTQSSPRTAHRDSLITVKSNVPQHVDLASEVESLPKVERSQSNATEDGLIVIEPRESRSGAHTPLDEPPHSAQTTPSELPASTLQLPSDGVFVTMEQARQLRETVGRAATAGECRVLVEMFLAQWGVPRDNKVEAEVSSSELPNEPVSEEQVHEQHLVDVLLSDDEVSPASGSPTNETSAPLVKHPVSEGNHSLNHSEDTQTDEDGHGPQTPVDDIPPSSQAAPPGGNSFVPQTQSNSPDSYSQHDSSSTVLYGDKPATTVTVPALAV
ncbi:hypothetical protein FRC03_000472 [Tulasnella sp. 419]|nr:hypothetical protein FRC03_000472 [Tulasnella sp. 419]